MASRKKKIDEYRIVFVDRILDNVHGFIELTKVEKELIKLPIFGRLQSIKQLSLVNWIFPGAEHTRYIHSLGVMHIIDKMAVQLKYSDEDRQVLRLAALLHDIGHYPFSHVGESVYKDNATDSKLDYVQMQRAKVKRDIDRLSDYDLHTVYKIDNHIYHHEKIGEMIIDSYQDIKLVIVKSCPFVKIEDLGAIIIGDYNRLDIADKIQLLHSEIDADRMDYLMRDSTFSGTSYGSFDYGILIKNLTIGEYNTHDGKKIKIVGIRPKGITAADQFMLNRFFSYTQIIANRHVAALEFMLQVMIKFMANSGMESFPKIGKLHDYVQDSSKNVTFLRFTDNFVWFCLQKICNEVHNKEFDEVRSIADLLIIHKGLDSMRDKDSNKVIEFSIVDDNLDSIKLELQNTEIYKSICSDNCIGIPMFQTISLTKHLPLIDFEKAIELEKSKLDHSDSGDLVRFKTQADLYRLVRMLDGLTVIDDVTQSHQLLIDSKQSILKSICKQKFTVLREYHLPNKME